jgi:ATP-dependent DNA helicase RecQ
LAAPHPGNGPCVPDTRRLRSTARKCFGWDELSDHQLSAMEALMQGHDVLAVLPTGAGKSAIYQVPAVLIGGLCVVVSPLIALQRDQRAGLEGTDAPDAVVVNSAQRAQETAQAWQAVADGSARYLFLSPEQLADTDVVARLAGAEVTLLVVDEAHCVSEWGHDFRPDYLRLVDAIERLGHPRVVALTATAAAPVRADIVERLGLRGHREVIAPVDRPNLHLAAHRHADAAMRDAEIVERAAELPGQGLVYVATRKAAEALAAALAERGRRARPYHAGRGRRDREADQEAFMSGAAEVMVATSAFGMGVDKPDVRFVLHAAAPASLDAYYQEIGRAGRDGEPAVVELHHHDRDFHLQRFLTARRPKPEALRAVLDALPPGETRTVDEIAGATTLSRARRTAVLNLLEQAGAVRIDVDGVNRTGAPAEQAVADAVAVAERRREIVRSRIDMMRTYADATGCRRAALLGYFGDERTERCGNCDTCDEPARAEQAQPPPDIGFVGGSAVGHDEFGAGTVMSVEADRVTVLFEEHGYKTIALSAADLLHPTG